ncbi:MAG TPA: biotin/lipoyl-containing protein, partial [Nocardioidaceae bacterium]|nr:biotin/lipoyl-containing protein [Nocardioidaceae bacterium]
TKALDGRTARPAVAPLSDEDRSGLGGDRRATLNRLLFPGPSRDFAESRAKFGDVSVLPTATYLYGMTPGEEYPVDLEEGKRLLLGVEAVGEPDERGFRTVMCTINGQLRPVSVRDRAVSADVPAQEKADPARVGHVAAPFDGVVTIAVAQGETVEAGATVATIEAMKMEASITAPVTGTVERLAVQGTQQVEGGDLVVVLGEPAAGASS